MNNEIKIAGFTGQENEFEFCMKVDNKWEEFKCYVDYKIAYNKSKGDHELILEDINVLIFDDSLEDYTQYKISKDELLNLQSWMEDRVDWEKHLDHDSYYNI